MMNNYEIDETAWKKNFSDMLQRLMGKRNISINKLAAEIWLTPSPFAIISIRKAFRLRLFEETGGLL